jgi:hypothetical protein
MSKTVTNPNETAAESSVNVSETAATPVKNKPAAGKKPAKKEKKLLSTFEFARAGAVALAIRQLKLSGHPEKLAAASEKVIALADKIYSEKTGASSNLKESKWNFLYATRFLKYYEQPAKK